MNVFVIVLAIVTFLILLLFGAKYYNVVLTLVVIPECTVSGILVYSVWSIRHTINELHAEDFYAKETLVYAHSCLFAGYCIFYIVQNGYIIHSG